MRPKLGLASTMVCLAVLGCHAQTTQSLISGRITDSATGRPISGAAITCERVATGIVRKQLSRPSGFYTMPLLPPGIYHLRAEAEGYQAREVYELQLAVASSLELDLPLRQLNDLWEEGLRGGSMMPDTRIVLNFYGPDVELGHWVVPASDRGRGGKLEATVSDVIHPELIEHLPFQGRDVYTMLLTQPGVVADAATARSLGMAANGQRPSASNFLLDGIEINNALVTGPLVALAPEAIQEYRVSTNTYSAEYGRTSGFLANATSRSGGNQWHGLAYWNWKNDALNANGFQQNRFGHPRAPLHEIQAGYSAAGPIRKEKLFLSSALERLRNRTRQPTDDFGVPNPELIDFACGVASRVSCRLLRQFRPPAGVNTGDAFVDVLSAAPPVSLDRWTTLNRLDYVLPGGRHHFMARVAAADSSRPDLIWSPYPDFVSGASQPATSVAASGITTGLKVSNEVRIGWTRDSYAVDRAQPQVPSIFVLSGNPGFRPTLPGSPSAYSLHVQNGTWEFGENLQWLRGAHTLKVGAGLLLRNLHTDFALGLQGAVRFPNIVQFGLDVNYQFLTAVSSRPGAPLQAPDPRRQYRYAQASSFAQDTWRVTPRLVLHYGVRYDFFGAPVNTGAVKDARIVLSQGASFPERLRGAQLAFPAGGDQQLYEGNDRGWAARLGASYDLTGTGATVLRAGYGIFYDRPFDNLWLNVTANSYYLPPSLDIGPGADYLAGVPAILAKVRSGFVKDFPRPALFQSSFARGYAQNYFAGVQQRLTSTWSLEADALGSVGRKLPSSDIVNRDFSAPPVPGQVGQRYNAQLADISYFAGQGFSGYHALTAIVRRRFSRGTFQLAYTWSRAIDNQSDPLAGGLFDVSPTNLVVRSVSAGAPANNEFQSFFVPYPAFSRQFDSRADRGNADFDQRQNLVLYSYWSLPAPAGRSFVGRLLRNWSFGQVAAFRSGLPFSVYTTSSIPVDGGYILNARARVTDPGAAVVDRGVAAAGGRQILDPKAFCRAACSSHETGRNAFTGPGLFNVDLSLARSLRLPWLGEGGRLRIRGDVFNFLNHSNLSPPNNFVPDPNFGLALFGRAARANGLPGNKPLVETAREFQLILRVEF